MRQRGFTRASTLGPIADVIEHAGGNARRVFARAELPMSLQQRPTVFVPLKDHFNLLQVAARELGDELFAARLGQSIRVEHLGTYGQWVIQAPTLLGAVERANRSLDKLMQSATVLRLRVEGGWAVWSYDSKDYSRVGRQQNEMLALCHMVEIVRYYAGADWQPDHIRVAGAPVQARAALDQLMQTPVRFQGEAGALVFPRQLLATLRPQHAASSLSLATLGDAINVPRPDDLHDTVSAMLELDMLDHLPRLHAVARKLNLSERTLQRRLAEQGASFTTLLQTAQQREACHLLMHGDLSVTEIAGRLGYADAGHFSRAFKRWTGLSPTRWRAQSSEAGWLTSAE